MKTARIPFLILVLQFSACANAPQSGQQNAVLQAKQQEAQQYCAGLYADSKLEPIRRKVPINLNTGESIPVEMMSNSQFPTEEEAQLILVYAQLGQDCHAHQTQVLGPPPAHFVAFRMANSQVLAELYARRITYGQYAGQINQNQMTFLQQDQALLSQAQRDALQAQQAFSRQLFQQQQLNLQRQQLLNLQFQPPPVSNPVNCTTQYIGNMASPNCQ